MLVLGRKKGQSFRIGNDITVKIIRVGNNVRIGIDAPPDVPVTREDALPERERSNRENVVAICCGGLSLDVVGNREIAEQCIPSMRVRRSGCDLVDAEVEFDGKHAVIEIAVYGSVADGFIPKNVFDAPTQLGLNGHQHQGENVRAPGEAWLSRSEAIDLAAKKNIEFLLAPEDSKPFYWAIPVEVGARFDDEIFTATMGPDGIGSMDTHHSLRVIRRVKPTREEQHRYSHTRRWFRDAIQNY